MSAGFDLGPGRRHGLREDDPQVHGLRAEPEFSLRMRAASSRSLMRRVISRTCRSAVAQACSTAASFRSRAI